MDLPAEALSSVVPPTVGAKLQTGVLLKEHSVTDANVSLDNLEGKNIIVGVPGAFTPTCSNQIPGYIKDADDFIAKGVKAIYVVTVNDQFVTEAWKDKLGASGNGKIHFLADDAGKFTAAIGMGFEATPILGSIRSHRYTMLVEDGIVKLIEQEPNNSKV
ncbi:hypothetical protein EMMF5_000090 [Cystobasidiomycetes sp. EMM_F5]